MYKGKKNVKVVRKSVSLLLKGKKMALEESVRANIEFRASLLLTRRLGGRQHQEGQGGAGCVAVAAAAVVVVAVVMEVVVMEWVVVILVFF